MQAPSRNTFLWIFGGIAVGGLAFIGRRSIVNLFGKVVDAGKELAFKASLPSRARPYSDLILRVSREEGLDPYLIFAVGDRESLWGDALKPKGPAGTGDWTPRTWGKSPMPPDGLGWGRGLMQLDYTYLPPGEWRDPLTNIRMGAKRLKEGISYFSQDKRGKTVTLSATAAERRGIAPGAYLDPRPLAGKDLWEAAIAAYNTGVLNVLYNIIAGKPAQFTTTGGDYVSDVENRGSGAAAKLA